MTALLCVSFFLSGIAALAFETLWFYQAGLGLGNSIWASSVVLASFMGGLGIGNGLVARYGDRLRHPLRLYAALELVIAISGFGLVALLPAITPLLAAALRPFVDAAWMLNGTRLAVSFGLLLVPAVAMGSTLPLLVSSLYRRDPRFGTALGRLYGWNTLGGVLGAVIGDAFLIEWFGIYGAAGAAALCNLSASALALRLALHLERTGAPARQPLATVARFSGDSSRVASLLAAAFLSGAVLLALEVVWFRLLLLVVTGTSMTFAVMLAVVLAGIGLGGLLTSRWLARDDSAARCLPAVAASAGVLCTVFFAAFGFLPRSFEWRSAIDWSETLQVALPLMFPVSVVSGVLFTLIGAALHRELPGETRVTGLLTLANTIGAMCGSLAAGFVLLPDLGVGGSIHLLTAAYALVALVLIPGARRREVAGRARRIFNYAAGCALLAVLAFFPSALMREYYVGYPIQRFLPEWTPVEGREGLTETIIYLREEAFGEPVAYRMLTNSHSMSSTVTRDARYMKLFVYWPVALHPAPKSALLIGYGVGITAKALTDSAALETIDVVDISRDALEMNRHVYPDPADYPLNDPRVTTHIEDGRFFLQITGRRFDIITGEPPPPKMAGVVSLYTVEYFELVRERLNEGGIASYWLPAHALTQRDAKVIARTFCSVFDDCTLWTGSGLDWMLIGTRNAKGPVSAEHFARQWADPVVGPEIRALGFELPEQLGALFMGGREYLLSLTADVEPLTDSHPKRLSETLVVQKAKFLPWMETAPARQRFERDPLVARLWPPTLRSASLAFFDEQAAYNQVLNFKIAPLDHLTEIHRWITQTQLETLPLWYLGSDENHQRAAARAWAAGRRSAAIHYHLGASALAQRDFVGALTHFRAVGEGDPYTELARLLEVYLLALDGRCERAEALAEERGLERGGGGPTESFATLLRELCPPRNAAGSPSDGPDPG